MKIKLLNARFLVGKRMLIFIMRSFIFFLCTTVFSLAPLKSLSQEKVIIDQDQLLTIDQVFEIIKKQTDYHFIYPKNVFKNSPKIKLKKGEVTVDALLNQSLSNNNLEFELTDNNTIVIKKYTIVQTLEKIQKISISGTIIDSNGQPLPGANIIEKGTTNGVTTDFDGDFSLSVENENAIIEISYIGFVTKDVPIKGQTDFQIILVEDAAKLDEVVIVGYGTQKKSDVTGSIASVKGSAISKQGTVNVSEALQGQVPGVAIVNSNGAPGAGASIIIRGQGSYGAVDPLYVVDGAITDGINFLDPNDIESIEVLKDASAAAIYGSRAANGVVLVTTKRGKSGKTKIALTTSFGFQTIANKLDFASSQEWRDREVWKYQNEGLAIPENLQTGNFNPSISTNWEDVLFRTAFQSNNNFSISGGGENNNFNFSLGFIDQPGIMVGSDYERLNIRINSDYKVGKFKFGESLTVFKTSSNYVTSTGLRSWPVPVLAPKDSDGNYLGIDNGWGINPGDDLLGANPLANIEIPNRDNSTVGFLANVYGELEIIKGLNFKTSASIDYGSNHSKIFTPVYTVGFITNTVADFAESKSENYTALWENTLNFNKRLGNHEITALVGWSRQLSQNRITRLEAEGFPSNIFEADAAETILASSGGNNTEISLESYLSRINYSYKNKYQLTATVRQDATSRLIKRLRKGTFPSFSMGWVLSEESFFPKNTFINRLKFRGGYGELGRLNAVGPYQVQNTLTFGGQNLDYILGSGQQFVNGAALTSITNEDVLWERAQSTNIALEASLFNNSVTLTAEYFVKNTQDLQFEAPIPYTVGTDVSSILLNAGDIQNKGMEITLGYQKSMGDFNFNVSGNLFAIRSKVLEFNNPDDSFVGGRYYLTGQNATRAVVGRELSNFWLLRTDGIFKSQAEVDAHTKDGVLIQPNAQPGDLRFKDINDDGKIDVQDKEFIDGSIPKFEYGLNFGASYKNFDFNLIFYGVAGQKIFNAVNLINADVLQAQTTDYWRPDNMDASYFRPSISDINQNKGDNDFYLEDAGYLRLRNVQIGYTIPSQVTSKFMVQSARLSLTAQNLFTFTKFTGYNPETVSFGIDRGVNRDVYPQPKTVLLGLSVNF